MAKSSGWTIAIRPEEGTPPRKITKIVPLSDGGFSVVAPYHKDRMGHLFKLPIAPKQGGQRMVPLTDCINFSASDRVKLSYHVDGFAQFSSENKNNIISGRDPLTKEPKGLGLITYPLKTPIWSGASVGVTTWGLSEFEELAAKKDGQIIVEPADCYYRASDDKNSDGWIISIYAFPKNSVPPVRMRNGRKYFNVAAERLNGGLLSIVEMQLLELNESSPINLAFFVNRTKVKFSPSSGWIINGPGDFTSEKEGHVLMARYPAELIVDAKSLDRST